MFTVFPSFLDFWQRCDRAHEPSHLPGRRRHRRRVGRPSVDPPDQTESRRSSCSRHPDPADGAAADHEGWDGTVQALSTQSTELYSNRVLFLFLKKDHGEWDLSELLITGSYTTELLKSRVCLVGRCRFNFIWQQLWQEFKAVDNTHLYEQVCKRVRFRRGKPAEAFTYCCVPTEGWNYAFTFAFSFLKCCLTGLFRGVIALKVKSILNDVNISVYLWCSAVKKI